MQVTPAPISSRFLCSWPPFSYLARPTKNRHATQASFELEFIKSFASLVSHVVNKPNTQLKRDANDFVNAKSLEGKRETFALRLVQLEDNSGWGKSGKMIITDSYTILSRHTL